MEAFDWSTQPPAAPSDHDGDLLAAFLGTSFDDQLHSDGNVSSDAYGGLDLPSSSAAASRHDLGLLRCHDGVTVPGGASSTGFPVGFLPVPAIAGTHDDRLRLDRFGFPVEPALAVGSNTAFSGYSTITCGGGGGGNISSGESNTYGGRGGGGHDTEVASSSSRPVVVMPAPSKRKLVLGKHPAATTTEQEAAEVRWGTKRAAAATTTSITFGRQSGGGSGGYEPDTETIEQVKEMIYRAAAMRPVNLAGPSSGAGRPSDQKPRRRKNVRISSDPQTVAARLRREKVSERLRALQRLVPGGSKMDTASMLDEAASYLRFLKSQLAALETIHAAAGSRSVQPRYVDTGGRSKNQSSQLSSGRDGITGYVKPSWNMQLSS